MISPRPSHLRFRQRGSALLAALCFATVLAIALSSYLTVCYRTLAMSTRGIQNTRSIQLAEVGMEEALWALNNTTWTTWTINGTTATKAITGFTFDGGATGEADVTITNYTGIGTRTVTVNGITYQSDGTSITRTLTATSAQAPLFVNAITGTTGKVKFKSAGTIDSYNSSLGDYGSQVATYSAVIASGSATTASATVQLNNAQVKGYVSSLYPSGTVGITAIPGAPSYSTSAKLIGPTTPVTTKIDPNQVSNSPYQPLFDENVPSGTSTPLPAGTTTIGTAGASTPALYTATDVTLAGAQVLTVDGPVILAVSGNLYISSTAKIQVTIHGSLEIHLAGDLAIDGNGIQNDTKLPRKVSLVAKADNIYDSLELGTTTPFYGVIYTPNNALTISSAPSIYGAIVAKSVTFSSSPSMHYDLDLRDSTRGVFNALITPYSVSDLHESTNGI